MSAASTHSVDPFGHFSDPAAAFRTSADDRDLNALERLFDRLTDEARGLRADARRLGKHVEHLGRLVADPFDR